MHNLMETRKLGSLGTLSTEIRPNLYINKREKGSNFFKKNILLFFDFEEETTIQEDSEYC